MEEQPSGVVRKRRRRRLVPPMYEVRFSMYNTHDGPVEGARAAGGKCGWTKAQPLPAGRTGRVEAGGVCLCTTYDVGCTI